MAAGKWTLDMGAMQDDFFADSAMIGIVTAAQAYRLCWVLNNSFGMNFVRDIEQNIMLQKKDNSFCFPVYCYDLPNSIHKHTLYRLKNGNEALLPEVRQLDFLWLIQTANPEHDAHKWMRELRNLPEVQLAQPLVAEQLKNLKNLIV